jgi:DNA-directed RNA polymerase subunit RPC12/RpoP
MESDQLEAEQFPEGLYYCSDCGKKTKHEYLQAIPVIFYESCLTEDIQKLEKEISELLTCVICAAEIPQNDEE